jgi:hypothetical protein
MSNFCNTQTSESDYILASIEQLCIKDKPNSGSNYYGGYNNLMKFIEICDKIYSGKTNVKFENFTLEDMMSYLFFTNISAKLKLDGENRSVCVDLVADPNNSNVTKHYSRNLEIKLNSDEHTKLAEFCYFVSVQSQGEFNRKYFLYNSL